MIYIVYFFLSLKLFQNKGGVLKFYFVYIQHILSPLLKLVMCLRHVEHVASLMIVMTSQRVFKLSIPGLLGSASMLLNWIQCFISPYNENTEQTIYKK